MSGEATGSPPRPEPARPASADTIAARWARTCFSQPNRVAAALAAMGAVAIGSVVPARHWSGPVLVTLLAAAGFATVDSGVRFSMGERLPRWSLQVDVALANLCVSVVAAAAATEHIDLANLYLLVVFYAFLYLPTRAALGHLAGAGAAYAVVLSLGPRPGEPPVVAWLAVFGTAMVLGAVVVGLVSVLRETARKDPLTGLANRRQWDERLEEEIRHSLRSGEPLSVMLIDLDDFKTVNDTNGHDFGDRLLRQAAGSWELATRGSRDFLARLGGDEFGLLAPGSDEIGIHSIARRLADVSPAGVSTSIGAATWDRIESASDLLRRADNAMYQSKRRHRRARALHPA